MSWDVTLCELVNTGIAEETAAAIFRVRGAQDLMDLNMRAGSSPRMSLDQLTWHHIPKDLNLHHYHSENLTSCKRFLSFKSIGNLTLPPPNLLSVVFFILLVRKSLAYWRVFTLGTLPHYSCVLCFSVVGLGVEEEHHSKIIHCEMYTFIN